MDTFSYSKLIIVIGKELHKPTDYMFEKEFINFLTKEGFTILASTPIPKLDIYQNENFKNHNIQSHFLIGVEGFVHEHAFFDELPKY